MRRKAKAKAKAKVDRTSEQSVRVVSTRTPTDDGGRAARRGAAAYDYSFGLREITRQEKERGRSIRGRVDRADGAAGVKGPDLRSVAYETVRRGLQRNPRLAYQFLRDSGGVWTQQNHAQVFDDITHMDRLTKSILGLAMIAKETERIWGPGTEPSDPHRFEARMQVARAIDRETGGHSMEVALADPAKWLELEERFSYDNMVDYKGNNDRSPDAP